MAVAVAWRPRTARHHVGALHVWRLVAWRRAVLHGQRVEERLDGGSHLSATAHHHVVLEVGEVHAAHVGFHLSGVRVHAHESGAQELLVVAYGVDGRHHRVHVAVVGEHRHVGRRVEGVVYLLLRRAVLLHGDVSLALRHRPCHDGVDLFGCEVSAERRVGALLGVFLVEGRLQEPCHVAVDRLLGISLHARVDGGVYAQAVGVDVPEGAVLLGVLLAPAAERVCGEGYGVDDILPLVPRGIVFRVGAIHHHVLSQEFAEINRRAVLVVGAVEAQLHGFGAVGLIVGT